MKELRFHLITALFSILFVFGAAFTTASQESPDFIEIYRTSLKLNKDRFDDLNHILVGDTILVPTLNGQGFVKRVAKAPDPVSGRHDCIWYISERHLAESQVANNADTIRTKKPEPKVTVVTPVESVDEDKTGFPWWLVLLIIVVIAVVLLFIFITPLKWRFKGKKNDL